MRSFVFLLLCLACWHSAWAGCPSALGIYDCNGPRNPCIATTCPRGQVCHVNNCGGCKSNCEAPGMVHILSVGGTQDNQEGLVELITDGPPGTPAVTGSTRQPAVTLERSQPANSSTNSSSNSSSAGATAQPASAENASAVPMAPSTCPPGTAVMRCMADPCASKRCRSGQVCESNYCGGCNAVCKPGTSTTSSSSGGSACPPGKPQAMCLVDPCRTKSCAAGQVCESNYCGGCNAVCKPKTSTTSSSGSACPPGKPRAMCLVDPCRTKSCAAGQVEAVWGWLNVRVKLLRRLQCSVHACSTGSRWCPSSQRAAHPAANRRPQLPDVPLQHHPLCSC
ncbi:hypothetical protein COO60DRAFT_477713 [Scenedesmus sp. NREL 46B-D3]|nr:hypothetical protein COO60DRAFT_477713 [Scenedesmus sp. NREL 46B-D3]